MNGVQAAIFSSSVMILLVLALRLFLKKHLRAGFFLRFGVCARCGCCCRSQSPRA